MEFLIPVKYSGVRHYRLEADTLEEALCKVGDTASLSAQFSLTVDDVTLSSTQFDVLAPSLMLTDEQLETWPYWEYGYHGVDGVDWRVGYTKEGKGSIPDFAEKCYPVPADWLDSWKDK